MSHLDQRSFRPRDTPAEHFPCFVDGAGDADPRLQKPDFGFAERQRRAEARVDVPVRVTLIKEDGRRLDAKVRDLSRGGVAAQLATGASFQEGEFVVAAFEHEGSRCEIGARVACSSGS